MLLSRYARLLQMLKVYHDISSSSGVMIHRLHEFTDDHPLPTLCNASNAGNKSCLLGCDLTKGSKTNAKTSLRTKGDHFSVSGREEST